MKRFLLLILVICVSISTFSQIEHGIEIHMYVDDRPVSIYLPSDYFESPKLFPVLYLLHGTDGNELSWFMEGEFANTLDQLISNGTVAKMVVVLPNVSPEMDGTYEIYFDKLRKKIEANFKVSHMKKYHAIAGLSMGGFYAMHISHFYPHQFDYIGLFSPIYTTKKMEIFKKSEDYLFGVDQMTPRVYRNVEAELKKQFAYRPELYYIAIGKMDFLYNQNELYRQFLDKNGYQYTYVETGGGHDWKNWKAYIKDFLPRLFKGGDADIETSEEIYKLLDE